MEGVEYNTPPSANPKGEASSENSTTSLNQKPIEGGIEESMHAPKNKGKEKVVASTSTPENTDTTHTQAVLTNSNERVEWNKVTSKKTFAVFFPFDNAPGKDVAAKKIATFDLVGSLTSYIGVNVTTVSNTKYIKVTLADQTDVEKIATLHFTNISNVHFVPYATLALSSPPATNLTLKIHDIPLDIDKPLFLAFLNRYDKVTSSKFHVRELYYQCIVTFANAGIIKKFNWSLNYGKHSFRVYPGNLTKEEFELRRKFDLKLSNMPSGTTAFDLQDILKEVKGLTCFIPRRQDANTYQKERYAYIQFKSNEDRIQAKAKAFQLKNRLLYFVDTQTKTCRLCGSHLHMVRSCKEAQRANAQVERNNRFARIYNRFNAKPSVSRNYKVLHGDEDTFNWDNPEPHYSRDISNTRKYDRSRSRSVH